MEHEVTVKNQNRNNALCPCARAPVRTLPSSSSPHSPSAPNNNNNHNRKHNRNTRPDLPPHICNLHPHLTLTLTPKRAHIIKTQHQSPCNNRLQPNPTTWFQGLVAPLHPCLRISGFSQITYFPLSRLAPWGSCAGLATLGLGCTILRPQRGTHVRGWR